MAGKGRFGFLLFFLVCGCFQRFFPIRAIETTDGIAFEFPELADGLSSKRRYELLDLMVTSRGCGSYCTHWDIVSAPGPGAAYLHSARIGYGEPVPATVVRTSAQALAPARYAVSATVQEYGPEGVLVRSLAMDSEFEVYRDSSGKLRVKGRDESGKFGGCK